ncbi:DNA polymerase-3 subunit gamma/tau [Persephonella hydrogeniphila]|uniref:DNA polymerase III subunit gamma/tau n=1 Tax=Persephonella hydrogeniphila TaxID=198703 RepID=A0A285NPC6_9AQUI|nr:DNA polymerase III subunit gamma/tau [Persephonella hydrogeniphila]SNZ11380.1 DNA polymerase-3 subunit gamma/tau [Persephonella hydrogeniphila]
MAYESFARKYRPKNFKEVVGQETVVRTLSNAIKLDRLSHAYIFAGSRGLGKTTIARIITKCLNCEEGITDTPCGKCENCIEIEKGSFPDMYEIDAASNRGIDDIRSIKENVSYAPIKGRYKVYIIDEAHMLTREAFNALLKTLEEPPPNNLFILATTELHKIPDTIRSRCQTFIFRPPNKAQIKEYLKRILENENIRYEEDALELIANASEGGVRDAASILDQAVIYGGGKIKKETTEELLGVIPEEIQKKFLENLKNKNLKELVKIIERLDREGYDLTIFWNQILESIHSALLSVVIEKEKDDIFSEEDLEFLIYANDIFKKALIESRAFHDKKDIFQLAVLKLRFMKNLISLEEILKNGVPEIKTEEKQEKKEESFDIQKAILKIGKEAGGIIAGALKNASIKEEENSFILLVDKTVAELLKDKLDIIEKYFPKPVKIEELEIKTERKKQKKRDESVDKVLELFQGKIISYKEE